MMRLPTAAGGSSVGLRVDRTDVQRVVKGRPTTNKRELYGVEFLAIANGYSWARGRLRGCHRFENKESDVPVGFRGRTNLPLRTAPDGRRLFVRSTRGSIYGVNITWPLQPDPLDAGVGRIYALAYSPDSSLLACGGRDNCVRIWDPALSNQLTTLPIPEVFALAFSPDGTTLAAGDIDGNIHRWDVKTWTPLSVWKGHSSRVAGLAFTPDGKRLISMSWDRTCKLWNLKNGDVEHTFSGPFDLFSGFALSPCGSEFAWLGSNENNTIQRWNLAQKTKSDLPFFSKGRGICYSPNGRWLAAVDARRHLFVWDRITEQVVNKVTGPGGALAFSPDNKTLASVGDKFLKLWDTSSFQELMSFESPTEELRSLVA